MMIKDQSKEYQKMLSGIHVSQELKEAVLRIPEQEGIQIRTRMKWKQTLVLAAVLILALGLATCVYAVTISIREDLSKNWSQSLNTDAPEDIEQMTLPEKTTLDIFTGEEVTVTLYTDPYWYDLLLKYGKIYQFEVYVDENDNHAYRYIRDFSEEELQGAIISPDCNWIKIEGKMYRLQMGLVNDIGSDADKEEIYRIEEGKTQIYDLTEDIRILRVYDVENWASLPGILADEGVAWVRDTVVRPLSEGRAAFYMTDTDGNTVFYKGETVYSDLVLDHIITTEEIASAEVSLYGYEIIINGERYIHVNDERDENGNVLQLHLIPKNSYYYINIFHQNHRFDYIKEAAPENNYPGKQDNELIDLYPGDEVFYTIEDWLEEEDE